MGGMLIQRKIHESYILVPHIFFKWRSIFAFDNFVAWLIVEFNAEFL